MVRRDFFATRADLVGLLGEVSESVSLDFTLRRHYATPDVRRYNGVDIPSLGVVNRDQPADEYLVTMPDTEVVLREVVIRGVPHFSVDQVLNPASACLTPGGSAGNSVLLRSVLTSLYKTPGSNKIMNLFKRVMTKRMFVKVNAFWVGPEAMAWLRDGKRLTIAVQAAPEFDLRML